MIYPYVDKYTIPEPINKMLILTPIGFRNKSLGFLVRYFKFYLKLGKNQIEEILDLWVSYACHPEYEKNTFKSDFHRFYYQNGLNYDSALAKKFGYIDFDNQIQIEKQDIYITNSFLKEMNAIDGKLVRIYLGLKMLEHLEKETTVEEIAKILKITERAVRSCLPELTKKQYIYVLKGNRRQKIPNQYRTSKITSFTDGYLKLSFNDAKALIDELGIGELKLYLFLSYKFYYGDCFMAQKNIGEYIGLKQNTISGLTKQLEDKYFLRITKTPILKYGQLIYSCTYTLLR